MPMEVFERVYHEAIEHPYGEGVKKGHTITERELDQIIAEVGSCGGYLLRTIVLDGPGRRQVLALHRSSLEHSGVVVEITTTESLASKIRPLMRLGKVIVTA